VPGVDQLEEEQVGAGLVDEGEDLLDDQVVVLEPDGAGALERLAQKLDDALLLLVQKPGEVGAGQREEVVEDSVAVEEDLLEAVVAVGAVGETQGAGALVVVGAVDHQAVGDLLLGQVGDGLVHPEHVLAEGAAVAAVADAVAPDDELVAGGEEADLGVGLVGVVEVAVVRFAARRDGVELNLVVGVAVQSNVSEHRYRPFPGAGWCCGRTKAPHVMALRWPCRRRRTRCPAAGARRPCGAPRGSGGSVRHGAGAAPGPPGGRPRY